MVHPKVGGEIPESDIGETIGLGEVDEHSRSDCNSDIAENNEFGVLGLVQWAGWVEVVDASGVTVDLALSTALTLTLVVVVARHVGEKVHGPAGELLTE